MGRIFVQVASSLNYQRILVYFKKISFTNKQFAKKTTESGQKWSTIPIKISVLILKINFIGLSVKYTWEEVMKQLRWKTI